MDELDSKIIQLMMRNARMPVKEIAKQVNLTLSLIHISEPTRP